jgi:hypothetical protein
MEKRYFLADYGYLSNTEYDLITNILNKKRHEEVFQRQKEKAKQELLQSLEQSIKDDYLTVPEVKTICRGWWQKTEEKRWCEAEGVER